MIAEGDGSGSFLLKSSRSSSSRDFGGRIGASYSIALQYLVLEELIEEWRGLSFLHPIVSVFSNICIIFSEHQLK